MIPDGFLPVGSLMVSRLGDIGGFYFQFIAFFAEGIVTFIKIIFRATVK